MKQVEIPQIYLTAEDRIRMYFKKDRGRILEFTVNYQALINGRWRVIMRIDTCHEYAHKHTFHLNNSVFLIKLPGDYNMLFTESKETIMKNFPKIKENFLAK